MKILYIITNSGSGGAQTHIAQLVEHMRATGNEVAVMSHPGGTLSEEVVSQGARFYPNPFFMNSFSVLRGIRIMREVRRAVADFKPDIVSLHSSTAGFWGRLAIHGSVPTVFTAHGWAFTDGVPFAKKTIARVAETFVALFARKIICVSEMDARLARTYHVASSKKIVTIHNGVEDFSSRLHSAREHLFDQKIRIVFVGRLCEPKQPESLVAAFHSLPSEIQSRAHVTIVGDGPKRHVLEDSIARYGLADSFTLAGDLPRERVLEILSNAFSKESCERTIFVLVSKYEGFPRSILEAMSLGMPVIASDVGGVNEVVGDTTGMLVPRNNVEVLAHALTFFISKPERIPEYGARGLAKVRQSFLLEHMLSETERVYKDIL